jgi:hypothetical protein
MRTAQIGFYFSGVLTAHLLFSASLSGLCTSDIDVLFKFCSIGEDGDVVGTNFNEAQVNRKILNTSIGQVDARVILGECTKKCCVTGKESDFATFSGTRDDLGCFSREKHPLR